MNELLGFVVLTGSLFPLLAWLAVSLFLTKIITKRSSKVSAIFIGKALVFLVILIAPFVDQIVGQTYLGYLCRTQGGFKVYHTVELPDKYWDDNGDPKFIKFTKIKNIPALDKVNGTLDLDVLVEYGFDRKDEEYSPVFGIWLFKHWYYEKKTGRVLAESRFFTYKGGWVSRVFSSNAGISCDTSGQPNTKANLLSIFVPEKHS